MRRDNVRPIINRQLTLDQTFLDPFIRQRQVKKLFALATVRKTFLNLPRSDHGSNRKRSGFYWNAIQNFVNDPMDDFEEFKKYGP
jgi:hypothetical protein